jgi:predicted deacylase
VDLLVRVVDQEVLVLDRVRGLIHRLNGTASVIWSRCDGNREVRQIAAEVAAAFDVDLETARRDATAAVRRLEELGLLDASGETPGQAARQDAEAN